MPHQWTKRRCPNRQIGHLWVAGKFSEKRNPGCQRDRLPTWQRLQQADSRKKPNSWTSVEPIDLPQAFRLGKRWILENRRFVSSERVHRPAGSVLVILCSRNEEREIIPRLRIYLSNSVHKKYDPFMKDILTSSSELIWTFINMNLYKLTN